MRVAFSGKARSGKDTSCEYLRDKYGGVILRFSESVYNIAGYIQEHLNFPVEKDPRLLQLIGEGMRNLYGKDIFARRLASTVNEIGEWVNIFVADLRHKEEADILKGLGFRLIRINREGLIPDRDPTHISEIDLDDYDKFDEIYNIKELNELYEILKTI
jgi:hypothetical protein